MELPQQDPAEIIKEQTGIPEGPVLNLLAAVASQVGTIQKKQDAFYVTVPPSIAPGTVIPDLDHLIQAAGAQPSEDPNEILARIRSQYGYVLVLSLIDAVDQVRKRVTTVTDRESMSLTPARTPESVAPMEEEQSEMHDVHRLQEGLRQLDTLLARVESQQNLGEESVEIRAARELRNELVIYCPKSKHFRKITTGEVLSNVSKETPIVVIVDKIKYPDDPEASLLLSETSEAPGKGANPRWCAALLDTDLRSPAWSAAILFGILSSLAHMTMGQRDKTRAGATLNDGVRMGMNLWAGGKLEQSKVIQEHPYTGPKLQAQIDREDPALVTVLAAIDEEVSEDPPASASEAAFRVSVYIGQIAKTHDFSEHAIDLSKSEHTRILGSFLMRVPRSYERKTGNEMSERDTQDIYLRGLRKVLLLAPASHAFYDRVRAVSQDQFTWGRLGDDAKVHCPASNGGVTCVTACLEECIRFQGTRHPPYLELQHTKEGPVSRISPLIERESITVPWAGIRLASQLMLTARAGRTREELPNEHDTPSWEARRRAHDIACETFLSLASEFTKIDSIPEFRHDDDYLYATVRLMDKWLPTGPPQSQHEAFIRIETFIYMLAASKMTLPAEFRGVADFVSRHRFRWEHMAKRWWESVCVDDVTFKELKESTDQGMEELRNALPPTQSDLPTEQQPYTPLTALRPLSALYPSILWNKQGDSQPMGVCKVSFRRTSRPEAHTFLSILVERESGILPPHKHMHIVAHPSTDATSEVLCIHMIPDAMQSQWRTIELSGELLDSSILATDITSRAMRGRFAFNPDQAWADNRARRTLVMMEACDQLGHASKDASILQELPRIFGDIECTSVTEIPTLMQRDDRLTELVLRTATFFGGNPLSARETAGRIIFLIDAFAAALPQGKSPNPLESGRYIYEAQIAIVSLTSDLETYIAKVAERIFPSLNKTLGDPELAGAPGHPPPPQNGEPTGQDSAPEPPTDTAPPTSPPTDTSPGGSPGATPPPPSGEPEPPPAPERDLGHEAMTLLKRRKDPRGLARHFLACATMDMDRTRTGQVRAWNTYKNKAGALIPDAVRGRGGKVRVPNSELPLLVVKATEAIEHAREDIDARSTPPSTVLTDAVAERIVLDASTAVLRDELKKLEPDELPVLLTSCCLALHHASICLSSRFPCPSDGTTLFHAMTYSFVRNLTQTENGTRVTAQSERELSPRFNDWAGIDELQTLRNTSPDERRTPEEEVALRLDAAHSCLGIHFNNAVSDRSRNERLLGEARQLSDALPPVIQSSTMKAALRMPAMDCRVIAEEGTALRIHRERKSLEFSTGKKSDNTACRVRPNGELRNVCSPHMIPMLDVQSRPLARELGHVHAFAMESLAVSCPSLLSADRFRQEADIMIGPDKIRIVAQKTADWSWIQPPVRLDRDSLSDACRLAGIDPADMGNYQCAVVELPEALRSPHMTIVEGPALFPDGSGQRQALTNSPANPPNRTDPTHHTESEHGEYRLLHATLNVLTQMGVDYLVHRPTQLPDQHIDETTVGESNIVAIDIADPLNVRMIFKSEESNIAYVMNTPTGDVSGNDLRTGTLSKYLKEHQNIDIYFHDPEQFMNVVRHALTGRNLYLAPDPAAGTAPDPSAFVQRHFSTLQSALEMICDAANSKSTTQQTPDTMTPSHVQLAVSGDAGIRSGRSFLEMCARQMGVDIEYGATGKARKQRANSMTRTEAQQFALGVLQRELYRAVPAQDSKPTP